MAHEINRNDQVVLHRQAAWHGLGIVVEDAPTPREAAKLVFPWTVETVPLFATVNGQQVQVRTHKLNVRSDDGTQLGVVTDGYHVVQPYDVADFAEALSQDRSVRVETAGSIRSGKRIWFLLKGEAFSVANGDEVFPYVLLSNGNDGTAAFRVTPTMVRAVCSNTLHMTIPHHETGTLGNAAICIRHTVNIMDRIAEARAALANYGKALEATKGFINMLTSKTVDRDAVNEFFLESYTADFGPIPKAPKDKGEERARNKATSAYQSFTKRFDDERAIAGATAWNLLNAYSGMIQHDQKARGKDDASRLEKRVESNLFGLNAERTLAAAGRAFRVALAL